MKTNLYNHAGYCDPTAFEALEHIRHEQNIKHTYYPMVYICSPFSGDVENNIINARKYSKYAVDKGCIPIAPHLLFPQFMNDKIPKERELAMIFNRILLSKCDEVWVFGSSISKGMQEEINLSKKKGYTIKYIDNICNIKERGAYNA